MALPLALPRITRKKTEQIEQRVTQLSGGYSIGNLRSLTSGSALSFSPTEELDAFHASEVIYRCADMNAAEMAALDIYIKQGEEEVRDDPVAQRFNQASVDADNAVSRKYVMFMQCEMRGESFMFLDRTESEAEPQDFINIWGRVQPIADRDLRDDDGNQRPRTDREKLSPLLAGFRAETEYGNIGLLPWQVMWPRYPHFTRPWMPMAPAEAARFPAELTREMRDWQYNETLHQARPSGVYHMGDVEQEEAQKAKAALEAQNSGAENAGRFVVTFGPGGTPGFSRVSLTPAEMSYLDSVKTNAESIALAMGTPIELLYGQSTFNNQDAAEKRWWASLKRKLRVVQAEFDRIVYPDPAKRAYFYLGSVEALQENTDAIEKRARSEWESDGSTWREYREKLGREVDNADPRADLTVTAFKLVTEQFYRAAPQSSNDPNVPASAARSVRALAGDITITQDIREDDDPSQEVRASVINVDRVLRSYDRHEKLLRKAVERMAEKQKNIVMRKLAKVNKRAEGDKNESPDINVIADAALLATVMREYLEPRMEDLWTESASATADALNFEPSDEFMGRVIEAMRERLDVLAEQVTETTRKVLEEELLLPGVKEGEGTIKLSDRILTRFEDLKTWRADTIARTETLSGANEAAAMGMESSGVVGGLRWHATEDARTRDSHREINGEEIVFGEKFSNGLRFPGDATAGKPDEVVNCRCVTLAVLKGAGA